MGKRYNRGPSESQSMAEYNAQVLANRGRTDADKNAASFRVNWDFNNREPRDLRECVRMVRAAYADEVPTKLHSSDEKRLGLDGTPKMMPPAESYIFDSPYSGEASRKCSCEDIEKAARLMDRPEVIAEGDKHYGACLAHPKNRPALDFYRTPFKAALTNLERSSPERSALVSHVTIGSQSPVEAAMREGVPVWCARMVAEDVLRSFLRNLTDIKVHLPAEAVA